MRGEIRTILILAAGVASIAAGSGLDTMPWRETGLTRDQAAVHLLNRFTFGPRPGDVEMVTAMGLDRWLDLQLTGALPETDLERRLSDIGVLGMPSTDIAQTYPNPGMVLRQARQAGVLPDDMDPEELTERDRRSIRRNVYRYASDLGYRPQRELMEALGDQKLARAVYASNQLSEVMTDFWFNHFNVSITDRSTRSWILQYERDAIRPNALGNFRDLLGATAQHPAMLLYLDNAISVAGEGSMTTLEWEADTAIRQVSNRGARQAMRSRLEDSLARQGDRRPGRATGLNENYARELLELHTLGVDGGYTQDDIIETARAFSGWTVLPVGTERERAERRLERLDRVGGLGFVVEGDFLFRADAHDAGPKFVLGTHIPPGGGLSDGETVLDRLSIHPSTAQHIAAKLAVRFVSDRPSQELTNRLAGIFLATGGDIAMVIREIAHSDEFWSEASSPTKIKSPFELAVSSVRATEATLTDSRELARWIERMGEPLYRCPAPTGFPDTADYWLNTGTLLNRINFASQLARDGIRGVDVDLYSPNGLTTADPAALAARLRPGRISTSAPAAAQSGESETASEDLIALILGSPDFQRR